MSKNTCERCGTNDLPEGLSVCSTGNDCIACNDCVCSDCSRCLYKHCKCDNSNSSSNSSNSSDDSEIDLIISLCMNKECQYYEHEGEFNFCSQCGIELVLKKWNQYAIPLKNKFCPNNCYPSSKTHAIYCGNCASTLLD